MLQILYAQGEKQNWEDDRFEPFVSLRQWTTPGNEEPNFGNDTILESGIVAPYPQKGNEIHQFVNHATRLFPAGMLAWECIREAIAEYDRLAKIAAEMGMGLPQKQETQPGAGDLPF